MNIDMKIRRKQDGSGKRGGFIDYLLRAFLNRWNLLALGAAAGFSIIGGWVDMVIPIALAFEILYLAALSTNERFQTIVDATILQTATEEKKAAGARSPEDFLRELGRQDRESFERLRRICLDLSHISTRVKGGADPDPGVLEMRLESINRLLWLYLKMLYSKKSLESFFSNIDQQEIVKQQKSVHERIEALGPESEDTPKEAQYRKSLSDTYSTAAMRLKNYQSVKDTYEFILLEIERMYSKISGIAEMSVSQEDPQTISHEIDVVSTSTMQTQKAMRDLESITGFAFEDSETPVLIGGREKEAPPGN